MCCVIKCALKCILAVVSIVVILIIIAIVCLVTLGDTCALYNAPPEGGCKDTCMWILPGTIGNEKGKSGICRAVPKADLKDSKVPEVPKEVPVPKRVLRALSETPETTVVPTTTEFAYTLPSNGNSTTVNNATIADAPQVDATSVVVSANKTTVSTPTAIPALVEGKVEEGKVEEEKVEEESEEESEK